MTDQMVADLRAAMEIKDKAARKVALVLAFGDLPEQGKVFCLLEKIPLLLNDEDLKSEVEALRIELGWD